MKQISASCPPIRFYFESYYRVIEDSELGPPLAPFFRRCLVTNRRQLRQRKRTDRNFHVSHGKVIEHASGQQIHGDAGQPKHDDIASKLCPTAEHDQPGDDFYDANAAHERCCAYRQNFCCHRAEVHPPVSQLVEILVDSRDDRSHAKTDSQRPPSSIETAIEIFHFCPLL